MHIEGVWEVFQYKPVPTSRQARSHRQNQLHASSLYFVNSVSRRISFTFRALHL